MICLGLKLISTDQTNSQQLKQMNQDKIRERDFN